jgi:2-haloacid dehalogenase
MDRYVIEPARAVFIDDRLENVEAAQALGLHGIHFVEAMAARQALRSLGLRI